MVERKSSGRSPRATRTGAEWAACKMMFEALQATGADTSGYSDWEHWASMRGLVDAMAAELLEAVKELRADYDEAIRRP